MQTCFTLCPPPPPPHMDDNWKWWQTQTAHVSTFLSAPIEVVTSPTMDPITRRLPNVISAQLMLQQGGTKRCSAVATLHENLSFGRKS